MGSSRWLSVFCVSCFPSRAMAKAMKKAGAMKAMKKAMKKAAAPAAAKPAKKAMKKARKKAAAPAAAKPAKKAMKKAMKAAKKAKKALTSFPGLRLRVNRFSKQWGRLVQLEGTGRHLQHVYVCSVRLKSVIMWRLPRVGGE